MITFENLEDFLTKLDEKTLEKIQLEETYFRIWWEHSCANSFSEEVRNFAMRVAFQAWLARGITSHGRN